jgi:protein-L-isoaspartate(D-aspartate) O-methyltransferase
MKLKSTYLNLILRTAGLIACVIFLFSSCNSQIKPGMDEYTKRRHSMVKNQIMLRGVKDSKVLDAMLEVERHLFVPPGARSEAYGDYPLSIGHGQTISQPYIVAFMTEALNLTGDEKVLEIGTGSGYQAAVLAEICDSVYTIDIIEPLAKSAAKLLGELGYKNVFVKTGDGYLGWPEHAPFDAIIVTCSPTHVPGPLEEQLAEDGYMIIPVGEQYYQELVLLKKKNGRLKRDNVLSVRFVPMINEKGNSY